MTQVKLHWSFWLIAVFAIVWNAMGVMNLVMQMDPEMLATYPESHRQLIATQPVWAYGGFVMSVVGGLLGGLLLLVKKSLATWLFIASFFGAAIVTVHTLSSGIQFSPSDIILTVVMPLAVAGALVWYSKRASRLGWV